MLIYPFIFLGYNPEAPAMSAALDFSVPPPPLMMNAGWRPNVQFGMAASGVSFLKPFKRTFLLANDRIWTSWGWNA